MKRFNKILCVADALEKQSGAIERASKLAVANEAELKIFDVVDDSPSWLGLFAPLQRELNQERSSRLQGLVAPLKSDKMTVTSELLHGRPAIEVTREVLRNGYDLVIKDARGTSSHKTLLFGSVDMRLLRHCPCPVWLHVPSRRRGHDVILAAIDPLAGSEEHQSMNRMILELGSSLAVFENAELHIIAAWEAVGESMLAGRISEDRLLAYVSENHHAAEEGLKRVVSQVHPHIDGSRIELQNGEPADVILNYAGRIECDLLIMGTVARGIPGLLMGNTADTVLRQIECSVLTVKPEGFVSPIKPA